MKLLSDSAAKEYYAKKTKIRKTMEIHKATTRKLEAFVLSEGRTNELYDFKVVPKRFVSGSGGPPGGRKGNVKRSNRAKRLTFIADRGKYMGKPYKAFTVQYQNGHRAIAQRIPDSTMRKKKNKEAIKSLYTISTPKMLEMIWGDDYLGETNRRVQDMLMRNIQFQINRFLGG